MGHKGQFNIEVSEDSGIRAPHFGTWRFGFMRTYRIRFRQEGAATAVQTIAGHVPHSRTIESAFACFHACLTELLIR